MFLVCSSVCVCGLCFSPLCTSFVCKKAGKVRHVMRIATVVISDNGAIDAGMEGVLTVG